MALKVAKLRTDPEKEENGVWFDYLEGARFKVAHISNPRYQAAALKIMREAGALDDETTRIDLQRLLAPAAARFLLLDWEGIILGAEGEELTPYSHEAAEEMLAGIRQVRQAVFAFATEVKPFLVPEGVRGNSSAPSNGASSSAVN